MPQEAPCAYYDPDLSVLQNAPYSIWRGTFSPKHHFTFTREPTIGEMKPLVAQPIDLAEALRDLFSTLADQL